MTQNNRPVQRRQGGYNPRPAGMASSAQRGLRPEAANRAKKPPMRKSGKFGGKLLRDFWKLAIVGALAIALGLGLQIMMPDGFPLNTSEVAGKDATAISEIHSSGSLRINEIMSSNGGVFMDESGATPDWIEIANVGNAPVNLEGYKLAKSANAGNVFTFPSQTLQPGECVIVIADSRSRETAGQEYHAPFRLSSVGDTLMLFNASDVAIDTVNIPALSSNAAYVRQDTKSWIVDTKCTPGLLNTEENYRSLTTVSQSGSVQITEAVSSNTRYAADENGVFHDYIILKNTSTETVDLSGWYLSDTIQMPRMWRIPNGVSLAGGEKLIIYCSGLNRTEDLSHLHTSFKLSSEGEQVVLSNADGQPLDMMDFGLLKTDTAYIRNEDGSWSVGTPTV